MGRRSARRRSAASVSQIMVSTNNFSDTRISLFSEATISTDGCASPNQAHRMITLFFEKRT
jgi:hypothetical protein